MLSSIIDVITILMYIALVLAVISDLVSMLLKKTPVLYFFQKILVGRRNIINRSQPDFSSQEYYRQEIIIIIRNFSKLCLSAFIFFLSSLLIITNIHSHVSLFYFFVIIIALFLFLVSLWGIARYLKNFIRAVQYVKEKQKSDKAT